VGLVAYFFLLKGFLFSSLAAEGFELYHLKKNRNFASDQTADKKSKTFKLAV